MEEFRDGYIALFAELERLSVQGVFASQQEAELKAKQKVEEYGGRCKAFVLRISAAYAES